MNKTIKKIGLILLLVVVLPSLVYTVFELSRLSENEKAYSDIYEKQLTAILNSVNQYTEDVISSWANRIELILTKKEISPASYEIELTNFLNDNRPVVFFFTSEGIDKKGPLTVYPPSTQLDLKETREKISKTIADNQDVIKRLINYRRANYRKIEPLFLDATEDLFLLVFALDDYKFCGIVCSQIQFINQFLTQKISQITQNNFYISIIEKETSEKIYSTGPFEDPELQQTKQLWLFPRLELGISMASSSIEELARTRTYTGLTLVIIINLLLIGGVIFVFRNVRKEVKLAQIKSDFVSNVSHELRTPLALIHMFVETLQMGRVKTEEKRDEYYSILLQETNRLSQIVNKILSFSKIEAGKRKFHFENVDLNELVDNVLATYTYHLESNGFAVKCNLADSLPAFNADKDAVSEALINLIDNAIKYSKDTKEISISTGKDNNNIFLEVADKGMGISNEDQKRIFEKFYRVTKGEVHDTKGTGLGLTIVQHIVHSHKGKIDLISSPGKGSAFKLIFPIEEE